MFSNKEEEIHDSNLIRIILNSHDIDENNGTIDVVSLDNSSNDTQKKNSVLNRNSMFTVLNSDTQNKNSKLEDLDENNIKNIIEDAYDINNFELEIKTGTPDFVLFPDFSTNFNPEKSKRRNKFRKNKIGKGPNKRIHSKNGRRRFIQGKIDFE